MSREFWAELEALDRARAPRFDPAYWRCPACRAGATGIFNVLTVAWAICQPCGLYRELGEGVFPDNFGTEEDDAEIVMTELSYAHYAGRSFDRRPVFMRDNTMTNGEVVLPNGTKVLHRTPTENLRLILEAEAAAKAAAAAPRAPRSATALERNAWVQTLAGEDGEARAKRDALRESYLPYIDYTFHVQLVAPYRPYQGETLTGKQCREFLALGAPFIAFYRALGTGEYTNRRAVRW